MTSRNRMVAFWLAVAAQVAVLVAVPLPKAQTLRSGRTVFLQVVPVDPYSLMSGYYATLSFDASVPGAYYPPGRHKPEETSQSLVREYMATMSYSPTTATLAQLGLTLADLRTEFPRQQLADPMDSKMLPGGNRALDKQGLLTTGSLESIRERAVQALQRQSVKTPFRDGDTVFAVLEARGPGEPWRPVRLSADLPANLPANQAALRGRFNAWRLEFGLEQFFIPEMERQDVDRELQDNRGKARAEIRVDATGGSALVALHVGPRTWRQE